MTDPAAALAFLTPSAVSVRSPLADAAFAAGGVLGERGGWELAVRFAERSVEERVLREVVGWADASPLRKVEVAQPPDAGPGLAQAVAGGWRCPIGPQRTLALGDVAAAGGIDVTCQLAALRLGGPAARETIARFCALDLRPREAPVGAFRPGSVARTPGYVLCEDADRYLLLFGAAYADYLWAVVTEAGTDLGGRPLGADVLGAVPARAGVVDA